MARPCIGTTGWSLPAASRDRFDDGTSLLARYATRFRAVEINTSFYRPHRRATYERWAEIVPPDFRFAVKAPKAMSHQKRLRDIDSELHRFADEISGLGGKLRVVLVQIPPGFAADPAAIDALARLHEGLPAPIAFEPRHASWFSPEIDAVLSDIGIVRVAADPTVVPMAEQPGGDRRRLYLRLHGAPRTYWSNYEPAALAAIATRLRRHRGEAWCIFDNTAAGHATANALDLAETMEMAGPTGIEPVFAT